MHLWLGGREPFSSTAPKPAPRPPPRRANPLPMRKFDPQRFKSTLPRRSTSITQQPTCGCKPLPTSSDGDRWTTWSSTTPRLAVQGDGKFGSCAKKLAACWHVCPRVHSLGSVRALVQTNVTGCARVEVRVEWRRQDQRPLGKGIVVLGACSGKQTSAEVVLSGKRASSFHTATVLLDALDGEDTYVVYFLPFNIDNGLGKLSARYLPPPRGAQRHGAAGCAGTRRVELQSRNSHDGFSEHTLAATADELRAAAAAAGVVALPLPADAPIGQLHHVPRAWARARSRRRRRWCSAAHAARPSSSKWACGRRRRRWCSSATRPSTRPRCGPSCAASASKAPTTGQPWRRGGGVPLDKGGTATLWLR